MEASAMRSGIGPKRLQAMREAADAALETIIERFKSDKVINKVLKEQGASSAGYFDLTIGGRGGFEGITRFGETRRDRGFTSEERQAFRGVADIEGTGSLELDQLNTKIANLAETIDANKSGFETFMKQFDTDEAKGISANINKMAKGLEAAAAGLKPAESATAQITKATDSTIKLAGEAATVFKETDAALKAMQRQITQLRIEIEQTEQELQGE
tara:strand:- start:172 stop:816 length:645 start_codon:yes stop_codon:yes gene_type:complete